MMQRIACALTVLILAMGLSASPAKATVLLVVGADLNPSDCSYYCQGEFSIFGQGRSEFYVTLEYQPLASIYFTGYSDGDCEDYSSPHPDQCSPYIDFTYYKNNVYGFTHDPTVLGDPVLDVLTYYIDYQVTPEYYGDAHFVITDNLSEALAFSVPEPTTWSLIILGFTSVGLALRRRRQAVARTF
jgi:hypothetical protein